MKRAGSWDGAGWLLALCSLLGCGNQAPPGEQALAGSGGSSSAGVAGAVGPASGAAATPRGGTSSAGEAASESGGGAGAGGAGPIGGAFGTAGTSDVGGAGGRSGAGGVAGGGVAGSGGAVDPASLPSVTLHLAGDSTVMTYATGSAQEGWGQELHAYFNPKLSINNQAQGGASVESFYEGRWKNLLTALEAGDYVMAAFGANDSGTVAGRHVDPPDFQARFGVMADEVKTKQATFIIVTPSALQQWVNGKPTNTRLEPYVTVLHALSGSKLLPLVDLNARSLELLNGVGQTAAQAIYLDGDKAHFTKQGATQMAELVALELTTIASPLADYRK